MRILIIGGTGLISTPITRMLLERGDDVTLFNRGRTAPRLPEGYRVIQGNRHNHAAFAARVDEEGPFDCVIDMVCFKPAEAKSVVRAFEGQTGQVIFCSTVDVYTKPASRHPITEAEGRHAVSDYGRGKVECEDVLLAAHERGDFAVTIIRPAHTYGPGGGGPIHSLGWRTTYLDRIRKGRPIVVHGDGRSMWVTCTAEDVARAFVNATGNEAAFGQAYHATGEEWMTWDGYHRGVAEAWGAPEPTLVHIPTDLLMKAAPEQAAICGANLQFNNLFDNARARADLGFEFTTRWVEGLKPTLAWLEENDRIEDCDTDPLDARIIEAWRRLGDAMVEELTGD